MSNVDPILVREFMRHAAGRGIAPVPVSGAGLDGTKKLQYHALVPLAETKRRETFGDSVLDELKKKIIDI